MFRKHQPIISKWARRSPENLARVIQFCIVSAREKFYDVPALLETCATEGPETANVLFGWKSRAYAEAWEQREAIHWTCEDVVIQSGDPNNMGKMYASYLLSYLATLHGLNLAKAGFVCQLAYGVSGCLDSLNVARLNLPARFCANHSQLKTPIGRLHRAVKYNRAIDGAGGTAKLWDDWCGHVSTRYPARFPDAETVSAHHLTCLNIQT